jgi:hypothetical protein
MPKLITNAAVTSAAVPWLGGPGIFKVAGTFGGATVSLQYLGPDGATWSDVGPDTTKVAAGGAWFILDPCQIRAVVSGGAPSGLYVTAEEQR